MLQLITLGLFAAAHVIYGDVCSTYNVDTSSTFYDPSPSCNACVAAGCSFCLASLTCFAPDDASASICGLDLVTANSGICPG